MSEIITASRLTTYRLCKRLHWYKYIRLRRPRAVPKSLAFGTVVHYGLAAWWLSIRAQVSEDEAFADLVENTALAYKANVESLGEEDFVRIEAMIRGYHARWWEDPKTSRWDVLYVEAPFEAPLYNPATRRTSVTYRRGGKIDAIVRDRATGEIWIVEHKTSGEDLSPGSTYWQKLRMDAQISTYYAGAIALLRDEDWGDRPMVIRGCLYDVLAKPQQKIRQATPEDDKKMTKGKKCKSCEGTGRSPFTAGYDCAACEGSGWKEQPKLYSKQRAEAETLDEYGERVRAAILETPDDYYQRAEVVRLDAELEEHALDDWSTAKSMHEERLALRFPRNPDACFRYGKEPCAYWNVCCGADDVNNDALFRDSKPNEEL